MEQYYPITHETISPDLKNSDKNLNMLKELSFVQVLLLTVLITFHCWDEKLCSTIFYSSLVMKQQ